MIQNSTNEELAIRKYELEQTHTRNLKGIVEDIIYVVEQIYEKVINVNNTAARYNKKKEYNRKQ